MPSLNELRNRYAVDANPVGKESDNDESLIVDVRSTMRPAQVVELKLGKALERGVSITYEPVRADPRAIPSE